jgi:hypothetical protein
LVQVEWKGLSTERDEAEVVGGLILHHEEKEAGRKRTSSSFPLPSSSIGFMVKIQSPGRVEDHHEEREES